MSKQEEINEDHEEIQKGPTNQAKKDMEAVTGYFDDAKESVDTLKLDKVIVENSIKLIF